MSEPPAPSTPSAIPPAVRQAIARRSTILASAFVACGTALVVGLFVAGETRLALGALVGHTLAVVCGLSWIAGAIATFDGPFGRFAVATLGLAPVRLVLVVVVVVVAASLGSASVDTTALGLTFVATTVLFQIAEADCFVQLSKAASPNARPPTPARFAGWKIW